MADTQGNMISAGSDAFVAVQEALDQFYIVVCGFLVIFGVIGCSLLESGVSRSKNSLIGMSKNLASLSLCVALFWLLGFAWTDLRGGNVFLGYHHFVGHNIEYPEYGEVFFLCTLVSFVMALLSRGICERLTILSHLIITALFAGFVWPVVAHWVWSTEGWLHKGVKVDDHPGRVHFVDNAGACCIHIFVAVVVVIGAVITGPRYKTSSQPASLVNACVGGLFLVIALLGTHIGLKRSISGNSGGRSEGHSLGIAAFNTIASGSAGALTVLAVTRIYKKTWDILAGINGFLAGQIAVSAGCFAFYPGIAFIVGILGGLSYILWGLVGKAFFDDPLRAFAVHFGGGLWGIFAAPLMIRDNSLFYDVSYYHFQVVGWNAVGVLAVVAWVALFSIPLFLVLKKLKILRVSKEMYNIGLDMYYHDQKAINLRLRRHDEDDYMKRTMTTKLKGGTLPKSKVRSELPAGNIVVSNPNNSDGNVYINMGDRSRSRSRSKSKSRSRSRSSDKRVHAEAVFGSDDEAETRVNVERPRFAETSLNFDNSGHKSRSRDRKSHSKSSSKSRSKSRSRSRSSSKKKSSSSSSSSSDKKSSGTSSSSSSNSTSSSSSSSSSSSTSKKRSSSSSSSSSKKRSSSSSSSSSKKRSSSSSSSSSKKRSSSSSSSSSKKRSSSSSSSSSSSKKRSSSSSSSSSKKKSSSSKKRSSSSSSSSSSSKKKSSSTSKS